MSSEVCDALPGVRATFNYLKRSGLKPHTYTFEPPAGELRFTGEIDQIDNIMVHNARPLQAELSLDKQGFLLQAHDTKVVDFYDDAEVRNVYYQEVEELLQAQTGAEKIVIFDHTRRAATGLEKAGAAPAQRVHNDYTAKSAWRRVMDHVDAAEAQERLKQPFAEINVWRPIRGPLEDMPLALCDASSVDADDFIAADLIYRDKIGEHYQFSHNPRHRWFYFPKMQRSEVILLKCFDSRDDAVARFTPHSAFDDPTSPIDRLPRESIEVRALVFVPKF